MKLIQSIDEIKNQLKGSEAPLYRNRGENVKIHIDAGNNLNRPFNFTPKLHIVDKAEGWVISYLSIRKYVEWNDFIIDLTARFRDDGPGKIVEQFNKLEDYVDEFESTRSLVLQNNHVLSESYILDSFIGGLKPSIKPFAKAFKPTTIAQVVEYARLQEESIMVNSTRYSRPVSTTINPYSQPKPL